VIRRRKPSRLADRAPQSGVASNHKRPTSLSGLTPAAPSGSKPFAAQDTSQVSAAALPLRRSRSFRTGLPAYSRDASGPDASFLNAPAFETFIPEAQTRARGYEPAARTRIEAQRPYAPRPQEIPERQARWIVVELSCGRRLVAIAAYKLRDRPRIFCLCKVLRHRSKARRAPAQDHRSY